MPSIEGRSSLYPSPIFCFVMPGLRADTLSKPDGGKKMAGSKPGHDELR